MTGFWRNIKVVVFNCCFEYSPLSGPCAYTLLNILGSGTNDVITTVSCLFVFFQCYDHSESHVRKASVFCLVAIHNIVGESVILPYLEELPATKVSTIVKTFTVLVNCFLLSNPMLCCLHLSSYQICPTSFDYYVFVVYIWSVVLVHVCCPCYNFSLFILQMKLLHLYIKRSQSNSNSTEV